MSGKRGGKRSGAGRKPGSPNRAGLEDRIALAEMAREYAPIALQVLCKIAQESDSDAARVSASNALLDRGYGKPPQAMEHTGANGGPVEFNVIVPGVTDAKNDDPSSNAN